MPPCCSAAPASAPAPPPTPAPSPSRPPPAASISSAGAGTAGSSTLKIIPYAVGDGSATGTGSDFVTYDAAGVRPLSAGEYASGITDGATQLDNVKLGAGVTLNLNTTINALLLGSGGSVDGTGTLTVNSGAILAPTAASTSISVAGLAFGTTTNEGVITNTGPMTITSNINAAAQTLTKTGGGTLNLDGAAYTTLKTVVNAGTVKRAGGDWTGTNIVVGPSGTLASAAGLTVNAGTDYGVLSGTTLTKNGAGTFIYANTTPPALTGAVTVNGGTLSYRPGNVVNTSLSFGVGTITLNGGIFGLNGNPGSGAAGNFYLANNLLVTSLGGTLDGARVNGNPTVIFTGNVDLQGNLALQPAGGNNQLGMNLTGTITLTGGDRTITASNYSGGYGVISGNILQDATPRKLTLVNAVSSQPLLVTSSLVGRHGRHPGWAGRAWFASPATTPRSPAASPFSRAPSPASTAPMPWARAGAVTVPLGAVADANFANFGGSSSSGDLQRFSTASQGTITLAANSNADINLSGYGAALRLGASGF